MTQAETFAKNAEAILSIPGNVLGNALSAVRPDDYITEEDSPVSWVLVGVLSIVAAAVIAVVWRARGKR